MEPLHEQQDVPDSAHADVEKTSAPPPANAAGVSEFFSPPAESFVPSETAKDLFADPPAAPANALAAGGAGDAPQPPWQPAASNGVTEALQKQIAARTASIDAQTKEKEMKQKEAAESYISEENAKREVRIKEVKQGHLKDQEEADLKRKEYKKGSFVWGGVGTHADLSKVNHYSKNTDRMRSILTRLIASEST